VDVAGNLVINDSFDNRIRVAAASTGTFYGQAMTAGDIYTVAGNGQFGFSGDGGQATAARLAEPFGAGTDAAGDVLIADFFHNRIRIVPASTGTFYGQPMTATDIYTAVGNGNCGSPSNGSQATSTPLCGPVSVTADAGNNLVLTDGNSVLTVTR
jgi:hypothetical protein